MELRLRAAARRPHRIPTPAATDAPASSTQRSAENAV